MGYSQAQLGDLAATIAAVDCDTIVIATTPGLRQADWARQRDPAVSTTEGRNPVAPICTDVVTGYLHGPHRSRRRS